jgi:hypothetical protein
MDDLMIYLGLTIIVCGLIVSSMMVWTAYFKNKK